MRDTTQFHAVHFGLGAASAVIAAPEPEVRARHGIPADDVRQGEMGKARQSELPSGGHQRGSVPRRRPPTSSRRLITRHQLLRISQPGWRRRRRPTGRHAYLTVPRAKASSDRTRRSTTHAHATTRCKQISSVCGSGSEQVSTCRPAMSLDPQCESYTGFV